VYSPTGEPLGEVVQRRLLVAGAEGDARVVQDCVPDESLTGHPMARFAGHHEFALRRDGTRRRYLGPAVIGGAVTVGDGALIGAGIWPSFGWAFSSWSVTLAPDRQLTGGRFFRGGRVMASIVGVAAPERGGQGAARLGAHRLPSARVLTGTFTRVDAGGRVLDEGRVTRRYVDAACWRETGMPHGELAMAISDGGEGSRALGALEDAPIDGVVQRYGPALEIDAVVGTDAFLESREIIDEGAERVVVLRRWLVDQVPLRLEVLRLKPEERDEKRA
jgi:hypothetical protein